jgi:16S rRNA (cytosine1402-N4)-methyltransferase
VGGFAHEPVLLEAVLAAVRPRSGGQYVDATVGGGGHAAAILAASAPQGRLLGCDRDPEAIAAAGLRLAEFAGRCELRTGLFERLSEWLPGASCEAVIADLGVSSPQLDRPERGFSFQVDGPLSMEMTPGSGRTAEGLVNEWTVEELTMLFQELGDERQARRIARAIGQERAKARIVSTRQLAGLIERVVPRRGSPVHPATRVFQALRMAVNDELGALQRGLEAAWRVLKPGGRLAVITFHSGEARIVKSFGQTRARDYEGSGEDDVPELRRPRPPLLAWVTRRPVMPADEEVARNPRARSAQLRVMEKLGSA